VVRERDEKVGGQGFDPSTQPGLTLRVLNGNSLVRKEEKGVRERGENKGGQGFDPSTQPGLTLIGSTECSKSA
jgi:hypothetical protein